MPRSFESSAARNLEAPKEAPRPRRKATAGEVRPIEYPKPPALLHEEARTTRPDMLETAKKYKEQQTNEEIEDVVGDYYKKQDTAEQRAKRADQDADRAVRRQKQGVDREIDKAIEKKFTKDDLKNRADNSMEARKSRYSALADKEEKRERVRVDSDIDKAINTWDESRKGENTLEARQARYAAQADMEEKREAARKAYDAKKAEEREPVTEVLDEWLMDEEPKMSQAEKQRRSDLQEKARVKLGEYNEKQERAQKARKGPEVLTEADIISEKKGKTAVERYREYMNAENEAVHISNRSEVLEKFGQEIQAKNEKLAVKEAELQAMKDSRNFAEDAVYAIAKLFGSSSEKKRDEDMARLQREINAMNLEVMHLRDDEHRMRRNLGQDERANRAFSGAGGGLRTGGSRPATFEEMGAKETEQEELSQDEVSDAALARIKQGYNEKRKGSRSQVEQTPAEIGREFRKRNQMADVHLDQSGLHATEEEQTNPELDAYKAKYDGAYSVEMGFFDQKKLAEFNKEVPESTMLFDKIGALIAEKNPGMEPKELNNVVVKAVLMFGTLRKAKQLIDPVAIAKTKKEISSFLDTFDVSEADYTKTTDGVVLQYAKEHPGKKMMKPPMKGRSQTESPTPDGLHIGNFNS